MVPDHIHVLKNAYSYDEHTAGRKSHERDGESPTRPKQSLFSCFLGTYFRNGKPVKIYVADILGRSIDT